MAKLKRIGDGAGDQGSTSQAILWDNEGKLKTIVSHKPTVGCSMLVGSPNARTYLSQDYWLTTIVTEILEESSDETYVKFKTGNSTYEWWL